MIGEFCKGLQAKIEKRIHEMEETLGKGGTKDWAEYRERVGFIRGLRTSVDLAKELLQASIDDEEENDGIL